MTPFCTEKVKLIKWAERHGLPKSLANNPKDRSKVKHIIARMKADLVVERLQAQMKKDDSTVRHAWNHACVNQPVVPESAMLLSAFTLLLLGPRSMALALIFTHTRRANPYLAGWQVTGIIHGSDPDAAGVGR